MTETIQAIVRSLSADVQALNAISHNVANISTPGFRATRAVPDFGVQAGMQVSTSEQDGPLTQTDRGLDLALRGSGFLVVERDGQPLLTRAGMLRIDAEGWLVNPNGDQVIGEGGPIQLSTSNVRVDAHGVIWEGSQAVAQLRIVAVADPARLQPASGGYAYEGQFEEWRGSVVQGSVERSNVDVAEETIRMMEITRHSESVQRAISIYDKAMDTGINRLGE
jgi:flagellar basal-body rod protein FlgF